MPDPMGKREIIAWTICGVLAVVAGVLYAKRSPNDVSAATQVWEAVSVDTSAARRDSMQRLAQAEANRVRDSITRAQARRVRDSLAAAQRAAAKTAPAPPTTTGSNPPPVISTPLTKREPAADSGGIAFIRVGARTSQSTIQVNGESRGALSIARWFPVPVGTVRLSISAPNCTAWDTSMTLTAGQRITIGVRNPRCQR